VDAVDVLINRRKQDQKLRVAGVPNNQPSSHGVSASASQDFGRMPNVKTSYLAQMDQTLSKALIEHEAEKTSASSGKMVRQKSLDPPSRNYLGESQDHHFEGKICIRCGVHFIDAGRRCR